MNVRIKDDMILCFAKMGVMLTNGVPIVTALKILEYEAYSDELKVVLRNAWERLESEPRERRVRLPQRGAIAAIFSEYAELLSEPVITLINAGEDTGCLDLMTRMIPEYLMFGDLKRWKDGRIDE